MRNQDGFTLIEMMVTLAVAILLIAVGVPSFRAITANNQAAAQANGLVTALNLTRGEAVKRGARVTLCKQDGNGDCATDGSDDNDWANGWLIFVDPSSPGTFDTGEELVRIWDKPSGNPTLLATDASANDVKFVSFDGMGAQQTGSVVTYTITNPGCRGKQVRVVTLTTTGQSSTASADCP